MNLRGLRILAAWNLSFHWFALGIVIPIMTLFLLDKGLSLAQVGIAFGVYGTATVLLELPTGGIADTMGRKRVYLFSLIFQMAGVFLLVFVQSYALILVCFVLQGVARSLSSGTMDAHFIDEFYRLNPEVNLQKEMARIGIFIPLGLGLGSLLGGIIPMTLGNWTVNTFFQSRYAANYLLLIGVLLIQVITTEFLVKEKRPVEKELGLIGGLRKMPEVLGTSIKYGLGHPVILLILLATFVWGFSISGLEQLWQPQVKSILNEGNGSWIYGLLMAGYFTAASLGNLIATPLCRLLRNNFALALFLSRLFMGGLYFILALQTGIIPFAFCYITLFMFNGMQSSPESSLFNDAVPSEKRSTLLSFSSLFLQAGGILGSVFLGFYAEAYSIKAAWIVASVVISLSALLYLLIPIYKRRKDGVHIEF